VNEKRVAPRHHVLKSAFIVISEKAPKLECTVKNISDGRAALAGFDNYRNSKKF